MLKPFFAFRLAMEGAEFIFTGRTEKEVLMNYLLERGLTPYECKQVHATTVKLYPKGEECDGVMITRGGTAAVVKGADCYPVFLYHRPFLIGLHCGYRSVGGGIIERGVELLRRYGVKPEKVLAVVGPGIDWINYPVKEDIFHLLGEGVDFVIEKNHATFLDIRGWVVKRLKCCGVKAVLSVHGDTYSEREFASHRLKDAGRNFGVGILL